MEQPRIVPRDEWLAARRDLLTREKALTRAQDALSAERRRLPMVTVDKAQVFETPGGSRTLAELFDGRSQLIVYHCMMGPDWTEGCASCSFPADHIDGSVAHLAHRDVTLMAVSRAPLSNIEAFRQRMGWPLGRYGSIMHTDAYAYNAHPRRCPAGARHAAEWPS